MSIQVLPKLTLAQAESEIVEQIKIVEQARAKVERAQVDLVDAEGNALIKIGQLLEHIRGKKLYTEAGFRGFNPYMEDRKAHGFKIGKRQAYRLIAGAKVVESVSDSDSGHTLNEWQARELANVPEPDRTAVLEAAAESGKVTAASIALAASHKYSPEEPVMQQRCPHCNGTGWI